MVDILLISELAFAFNQTSERKGELRAVFK